MLAGGGESCADIEHLRAQPVLFGQVASDSTLYRTVVGLGPGVVEDLLCAVAGARAVVWDRRGASRSNGAVVLDIDSTLVEVHCSGSGIVSGFRSLITQHRGGSMVL